MKFEMQAMKTKTLKSQRKFNYTILCMQFDNSDASNDIKRERPTRRTRNSDTCSAINSCFLLQSHIAKPNKSPMADEVILLDLKVSPFAARVRIALAEKRIEYESREEDLSNKSSLLLKTNPIYKQVPVLIHNGKPICESMVIVQYIDEVWNGKAPNLLPSDPHQRAHARFWVDYIDKKIYPIGSNLWVSKGEVKESSKQNLIECFKILEGELGDKPYFGGESFGYVDVALIPFYTFFYTFETLGNLIMVEECPKLVEWGKRCMLKKTVSESLSDQQEVYEEILELKKAAGC